MNEKQKEQLQIDCFNRCGGRVTEVINIGADMLTTYGLPRY